MSKQCTTERTSQRQRQIGDAFVELLQSAKFHEVSVSDICARIPMPRRSFYRYFDCREDLLETVLDNALCDGDVYAMFCIDEGVLRMKISYQRFFEYWKLQCPGLLNALTQNNLEWRLIERALYLNNAAYTFPSGADEEEQEYGTRFAVIGLFTMLFWWWRKGCVQTSEQMAEYAVRFLTEPLYNL